MTTTANATLTMDVFSDNHDSDVDIHDNDLEDCGDTQGNESPSSSSNISQHSKKIFKILTNKQESEKKAYSRSKSARKGRKNPWQSHEDVQVLELIKQHGLGWSKIAKIIGGRTGKQVRDRYLNYLRPDLKNNEFTAEEDQILITLFHELGNKWSKIADRIPGRSECQVKNRFYVHIRKNVLNSDISKKDMANLRLGEAELKIGKELSKPHSDAHSDPMIPEETSTVDSKGKEDDRPASPEENTQNKVPTLINLNLKPTQKIGETTPQPVLSSKSAVSEEESNPFSLRKGQASAFSRFAYGSNPGMKTELERSLFSINPERMIEDEYNRCLRNVEGELSKLEKMQKFHELMSRKRALELFYAKTLQDITVLRNSDHELFGQI